MKFWGHRRRGGGGVDAVAEVLFGSSTPERADDGLNPRLIMKNNGGGKKKRNVTWPQKTHTPNQKLLVPDHVTHLSWRLHVFGLGTSTLHFLFRFIEKRRSLIPPMTDDHSTHFRGSDCSPTSRLATCAPFFKKKNQITSQPPSLVKPPATEMGLYTTREKCRTIK